MFGEDRAPILHDKTRSGKSIHPKPLHGICEQGKKKSVSRSWISGETIRHLAAHGNTDTGRWEGKGRDDAGMGEEKAGHHILLAVSLRVSLFTIAPVHDSFQREL